MCQKKFKNEKVLPSLLGLNTLKHCTYIIINALNPYYIVSKNVHFEGNEVY